MTSTALPPVSVIIPVYNAGRYLGDALDSVAAQHYPNLEIIVVDDGSTDDSARVARTDKSRPRYHYQPNGGIGSARNAGIGLSSAELVAFLDADDLWLPGKLRAQVTALANDPGLDAVFGMVAQFVSPELTEDQKRSLRCATGQAVGYCATCMLVRRTVLERVGPFDTALQAGEFIDWFDRARDDGVRTMLLDDVVARRRLHLANTGRRQPLSRKDYARMAKKALDRRRAR